MKSELVLRIISAIVLLAICLPLIWLGGLPFLLMCVALSGLLLYELFGIYRSNPEELQANKAMWIVGGIVYALIPLICLPAIRGAVSPPGLYLLLLLFLSVWVTDIAAYFSGRYFGGPKLLPRVSPKKTWSGALGGLLGAMIIGGLFALSVEGLEKEATTGTSNARKFSKGTFPFPVGLASSSLVSDFQNEHNRHIPLHKQLPLPSSFLIDQQGRLIVIYKGKVSVDQILADATHSEGDRDARMVRSSPLGGQTIKHPRIEQVAVNQAEFLRFYAAAEFQGSGRIDEVARQYADVVIDANALQTMRVQL